MGGLPACELHGCVGIEGADGGSKAVEVVETGIVAVAFLVLLPWGENEERACHACLEAAFFWFPVLTDGFVLYVDERVQLLQAPFL